MFFSLSYTFFSAHCRAKRPRKQKTHHILRVPYYALYLLSISSYGNFFCLRLLEGDSLLYGFRADKRRAIALV